MKKMTEPKIGELTCPDGHNQRLATLPCDLPRATAVSLMFLDGKGRMMCEKTFDQPKGISEIEMRLPRLRGGKYNVWVELEGGILIREVEIGERERRGWMERLAGIFVAGRFISPVTCGEMNLPATKKTTMDDFVIFFAAIIVLVLLHLPGRQNDGKTEP